MEQLASLATREYEYRQDITNASSCMGKRRMSESSFYERKISPTNPISYPFHYPYVESLEPLSLQQVLNPVGQRKYSFPRDEHRNYICIYQGCTRPIRKETFEEYIEHLWHHAERGDFILTNMLQNLNLYHFGENLPRPLMQESHDEDIESEPNWNSPYCNLDDMKFDGNFSTKLRRTNSDSVAIRPHRRGSCCAHSCAQFSDFGSSSDETENFTVPTKPSARGIQLREQMLRYGLNLFRIDNEGKYICFFTGCQLHMTTNFSRHISKHEKNGDPIKEELQHLSKNPLPPQKENSPTLSPPNTTIITHATRLDLTDLTDLRDLVDPPLKKVLNQPLSPTSDVDEKQEIKWVFKTRNVS